MKRKNILYASFLLGVIAIFAFLVLAGTENTLDATPAINSPANYTNYSGNLVLNATHTGIANITNVTFYFNNSSSGTLTLNITAYPANSTSGVDAWNDTFNITIDTAATNTLLADGFYNVTIMAENVSSYSWNESEVNEVQIDNTNPAVTINSPGNATFLGSNVTSLVFNVTITDGGAGVQDIIDLGNNTWTNDSVDKSGTDASSFRFNRTVIVAELAEGANTLYIYANDTVNNTNDTEVITVYYDTTAPVINLTDDQYLQNYTWTEDTTPTLYYNFTDVSPNASCELFINDVGYGKNESALNSSWNDNDNFYSNITSITVNESLAVGVYNWTVNCTDLGNNTGSSLTTTEAFELDVVSPINVTTPTNASWTRDSTANGTDFTFNFISGFVNTSSDTATDQQNVTCELYISNSSGDFNTYGKNETALNNTVMTIKNNESFLEGEDTSSVLNVNWTMNCTFNGSSISQVEGDKDNTFILYIDNSTPTIPTLSLTTATSSSLTVAVTTSSDVIECTDTDPDTSITGSGASWTITKGSLASSTAYSFQVTCVDSASNTVQSLSYSYSTSGVSGSGSGGSGGGISSGTTGQYEKTVWASINAGETATVDVDNGVIGITTVEFKVSETTYGAWVEVQKVDTLPEDVQSFDAGEVYRNVRITTNNVENVLEDKAAVKFKVEKSWLTDNNIDKSNVALFRYVDDNWDQLPTAMDSDDGTYVHYTAKTDGFSYFVISEKKVGAGVAGEDVAEGEETIGEKVAEVVKEGMSKGLIVTLVVLVLAVAVVVFFWMRKRK